MEMQDLQLFVEVAKAQSFSLAAAKLHLGQPSVSQRIASLETNLGKPLFERHRRGVRLTEAGNTLLSYAERILVLVDDAVGAVCATPADRVRIRLAGPSTCNSYLLPPLLSALAEAGHDVELRDAHSHEVMQYILDGSADFGFVIDIPNQPGVKRIPVCTDEIVCIASPTHPLAMKAFEEGPLSLSQFGRHGIVFYRFSFDYDSLVQRVVSACDGLRNFIETTPAESVKAMLQSGRYISFLPRMTVAQEITRGDLVEVPVADLPPFTWNIGMVHRDRKELPKPVIAVLEAAQALWNFQS